MKRLLAVLAALLIAFACPAFAQQITSTPPSAGNLPAQPSTGSAPAGALGEYAIAKADGTTQCTGTASYTNASPAVVTCSGNTYAANCIGALKCVLPIYFTGFVGGNGISNNTAYFVDPASISGSTFKIATSVANALAGTDVNTTGSEGAVGTAVQAAYATTSGTPQPIAALSVTAGDWDCAVGGDENGVASTAPTSLRLGLSQASNTINFNDGSAVLLNLTFTTGAKENALVANPKRQSLSATTTVYGNMGTTWTGGATNPTMDGAVRCRRAG